MLVTSQEIDLGLFHGVENILQHFVYSSFGEIKKITDKNGAELSSPVVEHHFAFTGREFDEESNLYFYRARNYDPQIGRFLQTDPNPGNSYDPVSLINKNVYVSSNPLKFTDPSGEIKLRNVLAIAAGAATAFAAGFAIGVGMTSLMGPVGTMLAPLFGSIVGAHIGGEVTYGVNRLLGGSREESSDMKKYGQIAGALAGAFGAGFGSDYFNSSNDRGIASSGDSSEGAGHDQSECGNLKSSYNAIKYASWGFNAFTFLLPGGFWTKMAIWAPSKGGMLAGQTAAKAKYVSSCGPM